MTKQNFRNCCKFIEKVKLKYHIDISIQTLCYDTWNLAQVPSISLEYCWRPPVVNLIDWTLYGNAHTCLYKVSQLTMTVHIREVEGTAWKAQTGLCWDTNLGKLQKNIYKFFHKIWFPIVPYLFQLSMFARIYRIWPVKVYYGVHDAMYPNNVPMAFGRKKGPQHHIIFTILNSGDQVIFGIGIFLFMSNTWVLLAKKLNVSFIWPYCRTRFQSKFQ